MTNPIRPTDDAARELARGLMTAARYAALGVIAKDAPMVTRVAFGLTPASQPLTLISDLSAHTAALRANPVCSLLIGEPGPRGDPLTHPRLTLQATARFPGRETPEHKELAAHYLRDHPKARVYIGFADFQFVVFDIRQAFLNGGFGKAFVLSPGDLALPG